MITVSLLQKLNWMIKEETPLLRVVVDEANTESSYQKFQIQLIPSKYLDYEYHPLNVTKDLINDIATLLKSEGVKIDGWNNTQTTFWITKEKSNGKS